MESFSIFLQILVVVRQQKAERASSLIAQEFFESGKPSESTKMLLIKLINLPQLKRILQS